MWPISGSKTSKGISISLGVFSSMRDGLGICLAGISGDLSSTLGLEGSFSTFFSVVIFLSSFISGGNVIIEEPESILRFILAFGPILTVFSVDTASTTAFSSRIISLSESTIPFTLQSFPIRILPSDKTCPSTTVDSPSSTLPKALTLPYIWVLFPTLRSP